MSASSEQGVRRAGALGVHSVDRFVFSVPDIEEAKKFYELFGLDVRANGNRLDLYTFGNPHCWATVIADGRPKRLQYLTFGIYAEDESAFRNRIQKLGIAADPHPLGDKGGLWLRDPDSLAVQLIVAPKVSPAVKSQPAVSAAVPPGRGAAPARSVAPAVHPRRLSHVLRFSPDVPRMAAFCRDVLGLRTSDTSGELIAFMHGAHGSDHHLVAFAKSDAPGLHHSSWDMGSVHEVGWGSERMRSAGYDKGWGVGRHVLGSNYFYYVRDPWGSFAEYSYDIDFIPADLEWRSGDHPVEDSFYIWGPPCPDYFVQNHEAREETRQAA
jgi:catechol 2,3-dioxygenase-like lactoylglutathione lyase family enzyme